MTAVVGFQGPLSGPFGWLGSGLACAIEQALPADGSIRLQSADSVGAPDQPITAAQSLADNPDVVAVVGPTFSRETEASAAVLENAGIPFVLVVATKHELGTNGWERFQRIVATDEGRGPLVADLMLGVLGSKRPALLHEETETGNRVATVVGNALAGREHGVVARRTFDRGACTDGDVRALIEAEADAVFFVGEAADAAVAAKVLQTASPSVSFLTDDGARANSFIESAGEFAEGSIAVVPAAPLTDSDPDLIRKFMTRCGEPVVFAAEAFQAATLLVSLIQRVGADRGKVATALRNFDGVVAGRRIGFTAAGENRYQTFYAYRVNDGAWNPWQELSVAATVEVASAGRRSQ